ncbi:hypothetical protein ZIOFF_026536 [Zingiber officinale]|uniref:Histidinol-phosphatase n=1 Tax=Zingiber officinale TaxID=94328 RepID=A0A8J5H460_ZINOF|nr:hypothetical protein ZIOFF_026536 [Zingiber officinale]
MMLAFSSSFAARDLSSFSPSHQLIFVSSPIQSLLSTRPLLRLCPEAKRRIPSIAAYCAPIRGPEPSKGMAVVEEVDRFVEVANKVADSAGEVLRKYFRQSFVIIDKDDLSPVTIADREAEDSMVSIILETFPRHAIFGEENGWRCKEESADYVWVLDPIDGTKSFITGKPLFGTLIALLHKGKPVASLGFVFIGKKAMISLDYTFFSDEVTLTYTTSPHLFSGDAEKAFWRVRDKVKVPLYGCDCYAYALLASGFVDLVIESGLKPYDVLSLVPVIEGAGGSITDWKGLDVQWDATLNSHPASFNVIAAGDSNIHKQALDELQWK